MHMKEANVNSIRASGRRADKVVRCEDYGREVAVAVVAVAAVVGKQFGALSSLLG